MTGFAASAATVTWDGGAGTGAWGTGTNWSTNSVPAGTDLLVFNAAGANNQFLITLGGNKTAGSMTFSSTGTSGFTFNDSTARTLDAGPLTNNNVNTQTFGSFVTMVVGTADTYNAASGGFTFNGALTLSSTLTLSGSGAQAFNGTITNNGGNRTLQNNSTGTVSLAAINLSNNNTGRTLTINGSGDTTVTGVIGNGGTGAGNLTYSGSGLLSLTGTASTYTGNTTINGGTVAVSKLAAGGSNSSIGASAAAATNLVINGATLQYTGAGDSTNRLFTIGTAGATLDASGSGALTFNGTGSLVMSGSNTARTFTLTGNSTGSLAAVIGDNGTGATALTKTDTGTWTLANAANTYSGVTTISGGTLAVGTLAAGGSNSSIGKSSSAATNLVLDGGTLKYTGAAVSTNRLFTLTQNGGALDASGSGALTMNATGGMGLSGTGNRLLTLTGTNTGNNVLAATIADSGASITSLSKTGPGTWMLNGTNTYTGATTITAGTLKYGANNAVGTTSAVTISSGATLDLTTFNGTVGSLSGAGTVDLSGSAVSRTFTVGDATSTTFSGVIQDSGTGSTLNLAKQGSGTLTVTGTNNYSGSTTLNGGTLQIGNGGNTGSISSTSSIVNNGALVFDRTDSIAYSMPISGTGSVTQNGTGALTLSGSNSYSGGTTLNSGTLNLGAASAIGTGAFTINAGTFDNTSAAAITLSGNNGQNWNGSFAFSGTKDLNLGVGAITLNTTPTVTVTAGNLTAGGIISGANGLVKSGAGTLILSGVNTYTGPTTISQGTLQLNGSSLNGAAGTVGNATSAVVLNDAGTGANATSLLLGTSGTTIGRDVNVVNYGTGTTTVGGGFTSGNGTFSGNITLNKDATFAAAGTANVTFNGVVLGTGGITKTGAGTVTLSGNSANLYSGTTSVAAGTLFLSKSNGLAVAGNLTIGNGSGAATVQLGADNQIASTSAVTFNSTGGTPTLDLNGHSQTLASIASTNTGATLALGTPAGTSTFTVGDANNTTFSGAITGGSNAQFVKQGSGTLTLNGTSTFSGATTVSVGTLSLQSNSALAGTGGTTVLNGATLALQGGVSVGNGNVSLNGTGSGSGALTSVSGNNTWTGNVTLAGSSTVGSQNAGDSLSLGNVRPGSFSPSGSTQPTENGYITLGGQTLTLTGSGNVIVNSRIQDYAQSGGYGQTAGTLYTNATTVAHSPQTTKDNGTTFVAQTPPSAGNVTINMSGSGSVTFAANANTYTGTTSVQAGTLYLATAGNSAAPHDPSTDSFHAINGPLIIGTGSGTGATVQLGNGTAPENEIMGIGTTITMFKDGTLKINGMSQTIDALTFTGGTVNVGTGALYLNNSVTVNASAGNTATISGTGSLSLTLDRNVIADTGPDATRIFTVGHGAGNASDLTISAKIKNGGVIKEGSGTMTLTNGLNSYVGTTTVNGGILNVQAGTTGSVSALGSGDGTTGTGTIVSTGATLQLQGGIAVTNEMLTLNGSGYTPTDGSNAQGTSGVALGALNNKSGNNTFGAASTALINLAGDSRINSDSGLLTIATSITSSANNALTIGGAGNTTISGSINTGSGSTTTVTKLDYGTLTLSGSNGYQGKTDIQAGVVVAANDNALGAVSTGSNGTFVTSGAQLQLTGGLNIGGEALSLNGTGYYNGTSNDNTGALRNTSGANTFGGLVTIASASRINADSGTTLTLSGGTSSANNTLTVGGAGNTVISGNMTNGTGALTKDGSGTLTVSGTTGTVGQTHLTAGNMSVGGSTTLNTKEFDSTAGTTLTIATGGKVYASYAAGTTTYFSGAMAGGGAFEMDGHGNDTNNSSVLVFDHSFTASNLTLTLNGGTLKLTGAQITVGTIHITGNTILDFSNSAGTFLSSASLVIDAGVTVTVNNWISTANTAGSSTIWYATNTVNGGTLGTTNQYGGTPLGQVIFTNYNGMTTTWVAPGNTLGWFDHEIRPTPEPATYGALLLGSAVGFVLVRRRRRSGGSARP